MRIAVIGAGIGGLSTAWLLDGNHEVTLYEKNAFLGGHARTVQIEHHGKRAYANPAFGYIAPHLYPRFMRLLAHLRVPLIPSPASALVYAKHLGKPTFLSPTSQFARLPSILTRAGLQALVGVRAFFLKATALYTSEADWRLTLEDFCATTGASSALLDQVIYPWVAAICEARLDEVKGFSARAALLYPTLLQPRNVLAPYGMLELEGGVAAYIAPLTRTFTSTTIKTSCPIRSVTREHASYLVTDADGERRLFDHVVIAAPAHDAVAMLEAMPGTGRIAGFLAQCEYNHTRIVVHSDTSVLPANPALWSGYNAIFDGKECEATIWCRGRGEFQYFKTWRAFDSSPLEHVHAEFEFRHPKPTPALYRAQDAIAPLQGDENLWFAGTYLQDIDSHESGIMSGVNIARRLNPHSANLRVLTRDLDAAAGSAGAGLHRGQSAPPPAPARGATARDGTDGPRVTSRR